MKKFNLQCATVSIDLIRQDSFFMRVVANAITHDYFTNGVKQHGYYVRPRGYYLNGHYYLLGNKSSVDAIIDLGHDEIEIDVIEREGLDVTQFLLIFLSKEHKNIGCSLEYCQLALEYMSTPTGKEWFDKNFDVRDKEKRISTLMDISESECKSYFKLLQPGNEAERAAVVNGEMSLSAAYQQCCAKTRSNSNGSANTGTTGSAKNTPTESTGNDSPSGDKDHTPIPSTKKTALIIPLNGGTENAVEPDETPVGADVATIINMYGPKKDDGENETLPLEKVVLHFQGGETLELTGKPNLSADGTQITSTRQLMKTETGAYKIPLSMKSVYFTIHSAA
jgi:hypothetical protein